MDKRTQLNLVKKYQIALRRLYTSSASKEILTLVGTNKIHFINHINNQLIDGMDYSNFGTEWSLDHIVPVNAFDLTDNEQLHLCYNYINIMPMYNIDNRAKGASLHFSLLKLNTLESNDVVDKLINLCNNNIEEVYGKYLV
jgi:hypothetical protein